jgi:hypothetical protein
MIESARPPTLEDPPMTDVLPPPDDPKARKRYWKELRKMELKGGLLLYGDRPRTGADATPSRKASASASPTDGSGSGKHSQTRE